MASLDHLRNASTDVVADLGQPNKVGQASSGFEKYLFQGFACVLVGLDGKCEPGSANAHRASQDAGVGRMRVDGQWRQSAMSRGWRFFSKADVDLGRSTVTGQSAGDVDFVA